MGVKPAGGVNREVWMAEVGAYARGNGHVSSPLHQTRLCYSLIPEEPAMVDAAKHTHTSGMDDAFVAALAPKAHEKLGEDAGNALISSLRAARQVERAMSKAGDETGETGAVESALSGWSQAFSAAVRYVEQGTSGDQAAAVASALEALEHADAFYHAAKEAGILKPARPPGGTALYEPTEEDMLLAAAATRSGADILYRMEHED